MPKCDLDKIALQLHRNYTYALVFSCKFSAYYASMMKFFNKTT